MPSRLTLMLSLMLWPVLLLSSLAAAEPTLRQPVPDSHAIVGVRVVTAPGEHLDNTTIVMRRGVIEAVGQNITVPADARIHRFERDNDQPPITVYPGLIEPFFKVSVAEPELENGTPVGRHELINPDRVIRARDWPTSRMDGLTRAGFTTALLAPDHGLLRGSGAIVNLGDDGMSANLLNASFGQFAGLDGRAGRRQFPSSLMGAVALVRQTLDDARWQAQSRAIWARNPAQPRPEWLEGLDALAPALAGQTPLVFESQDLLDSLRIMELINDPAVNLVLVGHGAEYQRLSALQGRRVPHILPVNFPSTPDVKDEDDRDVSLEVLRHWNNAPNNPARLAAAGIPIMFTTHGLSNPTQLFANLAIAIEHGLDANTALAGLTTAPAEWLGIADRAGRIAPGYMANLVIVEGELLTEKPSLTEIWIDGQRSVLTALVAPAVDPAGQWSLTLGLGGMGDVEATLNLTGTPTQLNGVLSIMGNDTPLSDVRVSGERVIANIDASRLGGSGTITIRMDINGEQARGSGSGPFGDFSVRGQRTQRPNTEEVQL